MNSLKSAALFLATASVVGSAFAGAGTMKTIVTPLSPKVTYSIAGTTSPPRLDTYVGYSVTIANQGGNTINNIRFTGTTSVTDGAEAATFSSAEGATCTASADLKSINCVIGQLKAGVGFPAFAVFFKAPVKVVNGTADVEGEDEVSFSGITFYAEGTGGVPNSPPINSTERWAAADVVLGTNNPTLVKTAVPKLSTDFTFFTGEGAVSKSNDRFTTRVIVPPTTTFTTAEIFESVFTTLNCDNFYSCDQTQLTIPGTFTPYLTIILRQDKLNIRPGTKIGSVLINYLSDSNVLYEHIGDCASGPALTMSGVPCIAARKYYKNSSVAGWTRDLDGDFEWILISDSNGRIIFPR
jgi:hypothetical protein